MELRRAGPADLEAVGAVTLAAYEEFMGGPEDGYRDELADAAEVFAAALERVTGDQWRRTGRRSNGSVFSVTTLSEYYLPDVVHHLHDIGA